MLSVVSVLTQDANGNGRNETDVPEDSLLDDEALDAECARVEADNARLEGEVSCIGNFAFCKAAKVAKPVHSCLLNTRHSLHPRNMMAVSLGDIVSENLLQVG